MAENYLGEIRLFASEVIPSGWLPCEGQVMDTSKHTALYKLIEFTYGKDGRNFKLPDLRGRVAVGAVNQTGSRENAGSPGYAGGEEKVTLTAATTPPHTHLLAGYSKAGTSVTMAKGLLSAMTAESAMPAKVYADVTGEIPAKVSLHPDSVSAAGQGEGHDNMQPFVVLNYCICVQGAYPPQS